MFQHVSLLRDLGRTLRGRLSIKDGESTVLVTLSQEAVTLNENWEPNMKNERTPQGSTALSFWRTFAISGYSRLCPLSLSDRRNSARDKKFRQRKWRASAEFLKGTFADCKAKRRCSRQRPFCQPLYSQNTNPLNSCRNKQRRM